MTNKLTFGGFPNSHKKQELINDIFKDLEDTLLAILPDLTSGVLDQCVALKVRITEELSEPKP